MNDGNEGNNFPDRGQNNLMAQALVALAQAIGNIQPASANVLKEQNIAQVPKFNKYRNEDSAEWAKRFDMTCLINNWQANR